MKVGINYCGKYSNLRVARAVYNLFIKQINFIEDGLMVIHKDGNRYNNHYLNLDIQTNAQKQSKLINTERRIKLHKYHNQETRLKAVVARHKPVTQFCLQGNPIKSYKSIKEASSQTGIYGASIICATKHIKMVSAGGFLWQYGIITHKIDTSFYTEFIKKSKQKKPIPIAQISLDFKVVNQFKSITEAAKVSNIHHTKIAQALKDNNLLAGGFYWQLIENNAKVLYAYNPSPEIATHIAISTPNLQATKNALSSVPLW